MDINAIAQLVGGQVQIHLADLIALIEGQPIAIPVQPFTQQVAGKTLTVSLVSNAIQLQLH